MSAKQGLNMHPSVSGQVPLPLDHLHSMISSLLNSYLRAFVVSDSMTLTLCMHTACIEYYGMQMHIHIILLSRRCSCTCASGINNIVIRSQMSIYRRFIVLHLVCFALDRWHYDFIHIYKSAQSHTSKHTICISSIHNISL